MSSGKKIRNWLEQYAWEAMRRGLREIELPPGVEPCIMGVDATWDEMRNYAYGFPRIELSAPVGVPWREEVTVEVRISREDHAGGVEKPIVDEAISALMEKCVERAGAAPEIGDPPMGYKVGRLGRWWCADTEPPLPNEMYITEDGREDKENGHLQVHHVDRAHAVAACYAHRDREIDRLGVARADSGREADPEAIATLTAENEELMAQNAALRDAVDSLATRVQALEAELASGKHGDPPDPRPAEERDSMVKQACDMQERIRERYADALECRDLHGLSVVLRQGSKGGKIKAEAFCHKGPKDLSPSGIVSACLFYLEPVPENKAGVNYESTIGVRAGNLLRELVKQHDAKYGEPEGVAV